MSCKFFRTWRHSTDCDGIPEEPDASDEDYGKCKSNFPPSATIHCEKPGIFNNLSIEIRAVHCNGVVECLDGEDEAGCDQDSTTELLVTLGAGLVLIGCLSCFIVWSLDLKKTPVNDSAEAINTIKQQVSPPVPKNIVGDSEDESKVTSGMESSQEIQVPSKIEERANLNELFLAPDGDDTEASDTVKLDSDLLVTKHNTDDIEGEEDQTDESCTSKVASGLEPVQDIRIQPQIEVIGDLDEPFLATDDEQEIVIRKLVILQQSEPEQRKVHNQKYFQMILNKTPGNDAAEAINKIKLQLGPSVTKNIMEDIEEEEDQTDESCYDSCKSKVTSGLKCVQGIRCRVPPSITGSAP